MDTQSVITRTITVAGGRLAPGHLGELTQHLPFEMVDEALAATKTTQSRLRDLPSRVVVYLLLAACLFPEVGYSGVWRKLTAALGGLATATPSGSGLSQARQRVGIAPLRWLFDLLRGPAAMARQRGTRWRGLLVCAIDGTTLTVPDNIIHLIRNSFRLVARQNWDKLAKDLKPIYTAPNTEAAEYALEELDEKWGKQYGAMIRLWRNAWEEFVPFLDYDIEIRRMIWSTNAIESLNSRYRRAVRARGHFPTEQAALKCLYLVTRSLDPTGAGRARWQQRWMSRPAARCRCCHRSVSAGRSPNPACASRRTGLSAVGAVRRGWAA